MPLPTVTAVSLSPTHGFSKHPQLAIRLLAGLGVEGDAHAGPTTRHRYLVRKDPTRPNLTQVHLLPSELFAELALAGFPLAPGQFGENIATRGLDLLTLPTGTHLSLGAQALVELTGLRTPCAQIDSLHPGLMKAVTDRAARTRKGPAQHRAGVMAIVLHSGQVTPGDTIRIVLPPQPHQPLQPV